MAGHAQLKFVMTERSKTQIRLTGPNYCKASMQITSSTISRAFTEQSVTGLLKLHSSLILRRFKLISSNVVWNN